MFSVWYVVKNYVDYNENRNDVFNYCLFFNFKIVNQNKILVWVYFIKVGIIYIRDILYEVILGFLFVFCIVELIYEYDLEIKVKYIKDDYVILLLVILEEWKNIV